jgi:hypothetical protein
MCPYRPTNRHLPTIRKIPDDLWALSVESLVGMKNKFGLYSLPTTIETEARRN